MAKNGTILKTVGSVVVLLAIGAGIVSSHTSDNKDISQNKTDIAENSKDIAELDTVVCDPKDGLAVRAAVMQTTQQVMQGDIAEIKAGQKEAAKERKEGFEKILEKLK